MFILFGWRGVTYNARRGEFFCPQCRSRRGFEHKRVRNFFTLFFIPVIPLNLHGEYVECQGCAGTFKVEVLSPDFQQAIEAEELNAQQVRARFEAAAGQVMFLVARASGEPADGQVEVIRRMLGELTGRPVTQAAVAAELAGFDLPDSAVFQALQDLSGDLSDHGKQMLVNMATQVAAAGGGPDARQQDLIVRIAGVLSAGSLMNMLKSAGIAAIPAGMAPGTPALPQPGDAPPPSPAN